MISKIILILTILGIALSNTHLNIKYRDAVNGKEAVTEKIAR